MIILQRFRILPLLVLVAFLSLALRGGDFVQSLKYMGVAQAKQETHDVSDEPSSPSKGDEGGHAADVDKEVATGEGHSVPENSGLLALPDAPTEKIEWQDAADTEFTYSGVQKGIYKDLAMRRESVTKREQMMETKGALLEAAERELDQKMRELENIRNEIQALLKQQSEEESARITSLVKIYEGMKAKDAARIFNTLDMGVLLDVISRMSERKSAPVLAEMSAERARSVTILLAQQKQLPSLAAQ